MESSEHAHRTHRKRSSQNLKVGIVAGVGIGLAIVLGLFALSSGSPDTRATAAMMPGAGVLASGGPGR